jgi:hypothetical protein
MKSGLIKEVALGGSGLIRGVGAYYINMGERTVLIYIRVFRML